MNAVGVSLGNEDEVMAPVDEEWSALSGDEDHFYTKRSPKPSRKK